MSQRNPISNGLGVALLSAAIAGPVLAADFQTGLRAYKARDYETALEEWLPLAENGDLNAMYNIALIYDEGLGVPVDKKKADKWYFEPASRGDIAAQYNLATIYDYGQGVKEDDEEAVRWYRAAADQADEQAQFNLGFMYGIGEGVEIDFVESLR